MGWGPWAASAALLLAAIAGHLWLLWRSSYLKLHMPLWGATFAAGMVARAPAGGIELLLERWSGLDPRAGTGEQFPLLLYEFLVVAPLAQGLLVATVSAAWRVKRMRMRAGLPRDLETLEGSAFAASASLGFVTARSVQLLVSHGEGWMSVLRMALSLPIFVLLASMWGYAIGRAAHRGLSTRAFSSSWLAACVFTAVADRMIFRGGFGTLLAVVPLLLSLLAIALVGWRSTNPELRPSSGGRASLLTLAPAPSIGTIREAFRRHDQPLALRWIGVGALVTTGAILAGAAVTVALGHRMGVDFSAVDRPDAGSAAMAPIALLGAGVLLAFPLSGYLVARASATRSVLEPAVSSSLAMVLVLVLTGMMAPTAVVFVIAFAPIAFALTCAGAWLGVSA